MMHARPGPAGLRCLARDVRPRLWLPAGFERSIDFDQAGQFGSFGLGQAKLCDEEPGVGIQRLEVARHAALIAKVRETTRVLRGIDQQSLLFAELAQLSIT